MPTFNNLPAVWKEAETFQLSVPQDNMPKGNPELAKAFDDEDTNGFETPPSSLPIVSIRQKELKNDKGKIIVEAGGFRCYDSVMKSMEQQIPDISGEKGLVFVPLLDQTSRLYWPELDKDRPDCRSVDGKTGVGNPGGNCATCPHSQFHGDELPKCKQEINIFALDVKGNTAWTLRLGPSGLKPWNTLKGYVGRLSPHMKKLHTWIVRITTDYKAEPQPHYIPVFDLGDQVDVETFQKIKRLRREWLKAFESTVEIQNEQEETSAVNNELPEGVTPVDRSNNDDDSLPF